MNTSKNIFIHRFHGNVALSFAGNNRTIYISQEQAAWLRDKLQQAVVDIEHRTFERSRFDSCNYLGDRCRTLKELFDNGALAPVKAVKLELGLKDPNSKTVVVIPDRQRTDEEKIAAYLDWVNDYGTVKRFAAAYEITEEEAKALIEEGRKLHVSKVTTKDGLLWRNGKPIRVPFADVVAREHGFQYAEQLVKHLEEKQKPKKFTVIAVSSNTNSFGYKQVCILHESGEGYAVLVQAYGTHKVPERGEEVELRETRFYGAPEKLPVTHPSTAAKLIKSATHK